MAFSQVRLGLTHFSQWCIGVQDRKVDANPSERQPSNHRALLRIGRNALDRATAPQGWGAR